MNGSDNMTVDKRKTFVPVIFLIVSLALIATIILAAGGTGLAAGFTLPDVRMDFGPSTPGTPGATGDQTNTTFEILLALTVLTLAPSILIMLTGFTRIVIVLSLLRSALGVQQVPPNQVIIGLSLFLTFFVMSPVLTEINEDAYEPFQRGELSQEAFLDKAIKPIHRFMTDQTRESDVALFLRLSETPKPRTAADIPMYVLMPAFTISELKTAFQMAFAIFLPFLVVDMVVSSTLMSMGMMMLPPAMVSLPFKILLFILVNGWDLTVKSLVTSFR